jgi:diguanylate cyclase (GGDEF)-like protein
LRIQGPAAYAGVAAALRAGVEEAKRAYSPEAASPVAATEEARPVGQLTQAEMTPRVRQVIGQLVEEADRMRRALSAAMERIKELEKLADQDTLTPLGNRRFFVRELARAMDYCDRHNIPAALLFVDLDGLKAINDRYGHAGGDAALVHVARVLAASVRKSDSVARLAGDEFGVVLSHTDLDQATVKAGELADAIAAEPVAFGDQRFKVSASIGVCLVQPGDNPLETLARADRAMYVNKRDRQVA